MRSSTPTLSLVTRLTLLVSTSDTIALSFGFASTFIAIITVFVTRRAYLVPRLSHIRLLLLFTALISEFMCSRIYSKADWYLATTDLERPPNTRIGSAVQAHEDIMMEEMHLRRWSTIKSSESGS